MQELKDERPRSKKLRMSSYLCLLATNKIKIENNIANGKAVNEEKLNKAFFLIDGFKFNNEVREKIKLALQTVTFRSNKKL